MCTLTFASFSGRLRLVFNRDEQDSRAPALPPRFCHAGSRSAIMPIDPVSGGTWIGVNSAGFIVCLLNSSVPTPARVAESPPLLSRGTIAPRVLAAANCLEAAALIQELEPGQFPPYKLMMLERYRWCMAQSDGRSLHIHDIRAHLEPLMFASSGLGDELVDPPRRAMFNDILAANRFSPDVQDAFHSHQWADTPHLSVRMSRADAHTVSRTTIELSSNAAMTYEDLTHEGSSSIRLELDLIPPGEYARS